MVYIRVTDPAGLPANKPTMYILLLLLSFGLSGIAALYVKSQIAKYSQVPATSGLTGAQTAEHILRANGIYDVSVVPANGGMMGDHYNPANKTVNLSPDVYDGRSTAAVGVAAHECGHAIQHQQAYAPLQLRAAVVGITQFSSSLYYPLFLVMIMGFIAPHTGYTIMAAIALIIMLFQLITLPVEFDASRRAKQILPSLGIIHGPAESQAVSRVLNAAALTYVTAFLVSMANVLYYLMLANGGRRR